MQSRVRPGILPLLAKLFSEWQKAETSLFHVLLCKKVRTSRVAGFIGQVKVCGSS